MERGGSPDGLSRTTKRLPSGDISNAVDSAFISNRGSGARLQKAGVVVTPTANRRRPPTKKISLPFRLQRGCVPPFAETWRWFAPLGKSQTYTSFLPDSSEA